MFCLKLRGGLGDEWVSLDGTSVSDYEHTLCTLLALQVETSDAMGTCGLPQDRQGHLVVSGWSTVLPAWEEMPLEWVQRIFGQAARLLGGGISVKGGWRKLHGMGEGGTSVRETCRLANGAGQGRR